MKLQFKHQKFQEDASLAVCDVFAGQPYLQSSYLVDMGRVAAGQFDIEQTGFNNQRLLPAVEQDVLKNLHEVQKRNQIRLSDSLEGKYNLTVEMETGTGKTYTYIKTIYELNKRYGWSKFIVVVPSVAIREGVYKSFQITQDHFAEEYGKKIKFFIYNSARLTDLEQFAMDSGINVMIINSQAFNARGKDARRITMELEEFKYRRPIEVIAATNPVLIIDEPQSVEGEATSENLKKFKPLLTLRYSATPKKEYNVVYRLDAIDAYNKKLVKKIEVVGVTASGSTGTDGYLYLSAINIFKDKYPTATLEFEVKGKTSIRPVIRAVKQGDNLYDLSNELPEYKTGYVVASIDARDNSLEFTNGKRLYVGDVMGKVAEGQLRRIQIRETILAHLNKEKELYEKGIKVLSLFFIDEVAKYRQYDENGNQANGEYAQIFEEEYNNVLNQIKADLFLNESYKAYLESITSQATHAGYFSIDKKGRMVASKIANKKEGTSDDVDAYDLIMKDKESLLSLSTKDAKSKVRFIFSHSALREGWDNPNVFQICTLKESSAEIRKRQEVGRGLRLSVNKNGERQDENAIGAEVHNINVLTVIANESYESFAQGLQQELAEDSKHRITKLKAESFIGLILRNTQGEERKIDENLADDIVEGLIGEGYLKKGALTPEFYQDKQTGTLTLPDEIMPYQTDLVALLDRLTTGKLKIDNARANNVELSVNQDKLASKEFQMLWQKINAKSIYIVDFKTDELIKKAINAINTKLQINKIVFQIEKGKMDSIESKEQLEKGEAFTRNEGGRTLSAEVTVNKNIKYDLVGKIVEGTGLTRSAVVEILKGIDKTQFDQFKFNPEDFILKTVKLINDEKATAIIEHIAYNKLEDSYNTSIFTENTIKGQLGVNAVEVKNHLYNYLRYDSDKEKNFAEKLDNSEEVAVYVKLPSGFKISTPVGDYNPDWAIAFHEGQVKHIFFVAETKGTMDSLELREAESAKIACAREHFRAISTQAVQYDVVDTYENLLQKVMK
ncbi:MAG: DEAD/DEAH box helicase family protein [Elusimicrobiaceae bacterium]|nr:DEAD/DEAH box helicase family protein [Elusimicrobiaceae bacterium]